MISVIITVVGEGTLARSRYDGCLQSEPSKTPVRRRQPLVCKITQDPERRIDAKTREHLLLTLRAPRSVVVSLPRHSEFDRRSLPGAVIPTIAIALRYPTPTRRTACLSVLLLTLPACAPPKPPTKSHGQASSRGCHWLWSPFSPFACPFARPSAQDLRADLASYYCPSPPAFLDCPHGHITVGPGAGHIEPAPRQDER